MTDLDLIPTEDLVEEIQRRHDSAIITLRKCQTDTVDTRTMWWFGGLFNCLGLAEYTRQALLDRVMDSEKITGDDAEDTA